MYEIKRSSFICKSGRWTHILVLACFAGAYQVNSAKLGENYQSAEELEPDLSIVEDLRKLLPHEILIPLTTYTLKDGSMLEFKPIRIHNLVFFNFVAEFYSENVIEVRVGVNATYREFCSEVEVKSPNDRLVYSGTPILISTGMARPNQVETSITIVVITSTSDLVVDGVHIPSFSNHYKVLWLDGPDQRLKNGSEYNQHRFYMPQHEKEMSHLFFSHFREGIRDELKSFMNPELPDSFVAGS